jgi:aspartyl-tRNA(Asn)/glutamyl-tRNA(Gln) amidotransferase subunit C
MALDKQTVFKIARLARIYVDDVDVERYASELSSILEFVEQMDKIDTDNVAPLSHPQDRVLRLREDKVTEKDQRDIFQDVAPATENGLYLVPKVID